MPTGTIRVVIDSAGAVTGEKKVTRSLDNINRGAKGTATQIGKTQGSFSSFSKSLLGPLGIVVGLGAVVAGLRFVIKEGSKFQTAIAELSAITGAAGKDLKFLSDRSRELGRSTTKSASEVAIGFKLIASAKPDLLESGEALAEVTAAAITLAEAAGIDLPIAARALGGALNQFQADADQAGRFINVLAAGSQKGASEIPELTEALKKSGTVAAAANLSFETTIAVIETLAEVDLKASEAGTAFRNVLIRLQKEGIDSLNPKIVGFTTALRNLAAEERTDLELLKLFGDETFAAGLALLDRTDRTDELELAITGTNTAEEQAIINSATLEKRTVKLGNAFGDLAIALSGGVLPSLEDGVGFFTQWVNVITDAVDSTNNFADQVGSALGGVFRTQKGILTELEGATVGQIDERIKIEQAVLAKMQAANTGVLDSFTDLISLGFNEAGQRADIENIGVFIAKLNKLKAEAQAVVDAPTPKSEEEIAAAKAAADERLKLAKLELEAQKKAEKLQKERDAEAKRRAKERARDAERAAKEQQRAFVDLRGELDPLAQATRDFEAAEAVLNKQLQLGKIEADELATLNAALEKSFNDARDPIGALNAKLAEERELITLTNAERGIEIRVRQLVNDLKASGVKDADKLADGIRKELTAQEELNKAQMLQATILKEIQGPQEELNNRIEALGVLFDTNKISIEEFTEKLAELKLGTKEASEALKEGFAGGLEEALANLTDVAQQEKMLVVDAFKGMEDGIVGFVKTGKLEFGSLIDSILDDLIRLQVKQVAAGIFGGKDGEGGGLSGGLLGNLFNQASGLFSGGGSTTSNLGGFEAASGVGGGGFFSGLTSLFGGAQDGRVATQPTFTTLAEKGPEAIIPLKGGSIPVEVTESSRPPILIQNTFTFPNADIATFRRSQGQLGRIAGETFQRAVSRNG